jgi:hypothetical protein
MSLPVGDGAAWSGAERALLERAIRRHGGWDAWQSLRVLTIEPKVLSGMLPWLKGHRRTFRLPQRAEVHPHEQRAVFFDYPTAGARATFARGSLTMTDPGGAIVSSTADARSTFRGWRKARRWSPADALYFFGYALTHYQGLPFTLAQGTPLRSRRVRYAGRTLTGVEVELPADLHTHCRRQTFYFEEDGLLRRHDYVADIVGAWARGAHFWRDFVTVAGLEMPRVRHVVARLGRIPTPFVALHAELAIS